MNESTAHDIEQDLFPQLGLSDFEAEENEFELLAGKALSALFNASGMGSSDIGGSKGELEKNYEGTRSAASSETGSPTLLYDGGDTKGVGIDSTTAEDEDPLFPSYSRTDSISSSASASHCFSEGDVVEDSPLYANGGFRGERYYLSSRRELGAGVRSNSNSSTGSSNDGGVIDYAVSPSTSPSKSPLVPAPATISTKQSSLATRRAIRRSPSPPTASTISLIPSTPESAPRKTSINLELLRLGSPSAGIDGRGIDGLMTRSTRRRNSSVSPSRSTSTSLINPTTTGGFELSVVARNGAGGLASPLRGVVEGMSGMSGSVTEEEERGRLECPLTPGLDKLSIRREGGFVF